MSTVVSLGIPLLLLVSAAVPAIRQMRGPAHPLRLLSEALSSGFLLLVVGGVIGLPGWWGLAWWAVLVLTLLGLGASLRRSLSAGAPTAAPAAAAGPGAIRMRPPSRPTLVLEALLWAGVLVLALLAG
ncbi:hypothetical protein [Brachybacterium hainanense]|uniref:Hydrogenase n=1 Tax=Brachybacterium hainanense TaxID=1541174 RepID=A0ABV6RBT3_9MICO